MPTHGAFKVQSQDEVRVERTDKLQQWVGICQEKAKLKEYIRGWGDYYHLANMKRLLLETDEWLRRRIRMCIWKAWKKVKTRVANLIRCGINKYKAYEWGNTRKGYWHIADCYILHRAIANANEHLCRAGYATIMGRISNGTPNRNRRMRNRMYGGVRDRKTKVGRKLFRFSPTRFCT